MIDQSILLQPYRTAPQPSAKSSIPHSANITIIPVASIRLGSCGVRS